MRPKVTEGGQSATWAGVKERLTVAGLLAAPGSEADEDAGQGAEGHEPERSPRGAAHGAALTGDPKHPRHYAISRRAESA